MKRKNIKKHTKHQIKMLLIAVLLISVLPAISAADFAAGAEEQLGGSQSVTVSGTEQGWVVEFVLAGPGLYAQTGQSEILLHSVAIAQGQGFNAADHGGQFPSNETVREESRYDLWPNSFGYGFNEWSFNGQWQTKDPLTGGAYTLDLEDFSLQQPTENQPLRIYTHFQQLLITCDATLREAVGRTLAGVPARLVLQNSFEAQVPQPVEIPYGHEITIDSVDENDNTYLNHLGARHFYVPGETVLRLESITLRGAALSDGNPEVFVNGGIEVYGGTLYINPGAAIVYNRGEYGGGVSVYDGHVVMSGGLIHGNHSSSGGGGARVERGSFTISGGYITENTTGDEERLGWSWTDDYINGGGVFVTGGDFVMHSGVIRGNAAWGYRFSNGLGSTGGGGVAVSRGCFTMYGGEISGNYTDGAGGGVGLRLGNAVMHAGDISGNTAKSEGGGLYLFCGDFTMYDGHIGQNKVSQGRSQDYGGGGGGVHVTWGDFIMHGGIISENTAFSWGGGVYVFGFAPESLRGENQWVSGGNVIMNGGTITRNSTGADSVGGGIYVRRGTFTMHDGLISENKAGEQGGGGVFVYGDAEVQDIWVVGDEGGWEAVGEEFRSIGEVTLHGGTIRDNETSGPGGGVFAFGSNMTMHSGIISGNSSGPFGGGGVFIRSDKLVLGRFDNETWETFEEEIHYGGAFVMYGGSISNNRTVGPGGGVHSFSGDFTMHGGGISGNMSGLFGGGGVFVHASSKGWLVRNLHWADAEGTWSEVASQWIYIQNEDPQLEGVWVPFALWVLHNAENTEIKPDLRQGGSFTMTGGLINGNQTLGAPTGGGGGVGVLNGTFAVSGDSVISNNTAAGRNGGGLHLSFAEAVVDGGVSILGNQAVNGGGAYVGTNALLSMSGGEMAGNRAQLDGGGIFAQEHTYIYPMLPEEGMPHYPGLDIGSKVVFDGNTAGNGAFAPPHNAADATNIAVTASRSAGTVHALNNFDINFVSEMRIDVEEPDGPDEPVEPVEPNGPGETGEPDRPGETSEPGESGNQDRTAAPGEPSDGVGRPATDEGRSGLLIPLSERHHAYLIGFDDGTVRPSANITRAQVATVFFRLLDEAFRADMWEQSNSFSDVSLGNWFNNAVSTLSNIGLVRGYPDGTFRPDSPVTRAEFAAIAARFADAADISESGFSDIDGHWAKNYINRLAQLGWIRGYEDGTFRPQNEITRAEAAAIVNRMSRRLLNSVSDILTEEEGLHVWPDVEEGAWYHLYKMEATHSTEFGRVSEDGDFKYWRVILPHIDWSVLERPYSRPEHLRLPG